jgi:hypothetical protein
LAELTGFYGVSQKPCFSYAWGFLGSKMLSGIIPARTSQNYGNLLAASISELKARASNCFSIKK